MYIYIIELFISPYLLEQSHIISSPVFFLLQKGIMSAMKNVYVGTTSKQEFLTLARLLRFSLARFIHNKITEWTDSEGEERKFKLMYHSQTFLHITYRIITFTLNTRCITFSSKTKTPSEH